MNQSDWELMLILAEERNITKSAERLFTSQSTVSYRLKNLENELNTTLFDRSKSGISFTLNGQLFLKYAKSMLTQYEALLHQINNASFDTPSDNLYVGTTSSLAQHIFPYMLKSFSVLYPNIHILLHSNNSNEILKMMVDNKLDVSIVRGEVDWAEGKELIYEEPIFLVSKFPLTLSDLPSTPFLTHTYSNANSQIQKWWKQNYGDLEPKISVEVDNIEVSLQLLLQGFGWSILPSLSLVGKKALTTIPLRWADNTPVTRQTWLLHKDKETKLSVDLFRNFSCINIPQYMERAFSGKMR